MQRRSQDCHAKDLFPLRTDQAADDRVLQKEYKLSDIPVKEITVTHIENFYLYLRQECEVSNNTAMKFVQRFHTILLFAQKSGLSFIDPFGNFKFNFDKTDRGYLTQEEIDTIYYKEFKSKRLEHVRDAFIFSCYTGLPYCDIYTLSSEDIKIGVDGKKWIMKDRVKPEWSHSFPYCKYRWIFSPNMRAN